MSSGDQPLLHISQVFGLWMLSAYFVISQQRQTLLHSTLSMDVSADEVEQKSQKDDRGYDPFDNICGLCFN